MKKPDDTALSDPNPAPEPSLASLQAIEKLGDRTKLRPKSLRLPALKLAPAVFQWRRPGSDPVNSHAQKKELVRFLEARDKDKPLDAILVTAIGNDCYVVDGHHRHAAYQHVHWKRPIPVAWFEGSVAAARDKALECNKTGKLSILPADRSEAAWQFVKEGDPRSKLELAKLTDVGERTIGYMRALFRDRPELRGGTWRQALAGKPLTSEQFDHDAWREKAVDKLVAQLLRNTGGKFRDKPDILAQCIEKISPELPAALIREWRHFIVDALLEDDLEEDTDDERMALGDQLRAFVNPVDI